MISLTKWIYIIKTLLKSNLSRNQIREVILEKCLYSRKRFLGAYQVDSQNVWNNIISKDKGCCSRMVDLKITSIEGVISYYEEIQYKNMRATYPKKRHKRGA